MEEIWPILGGEEFGEGLAVQRKAEGEWLRGESEGLGRGAVFVWSENLWNGAVLRQRDRLNSAVTVCAPLLAVTLI